MKLKHLALATVFASAAIFAGSAQARVASAMGGDVESQAEPAPQDYGPAGHRGGDWRRGNPPPPPQVPPPAHRPPGPYAGGDGRHPGYGGHPGRHGDWDRKKRRDRYRDGAAVVLGLGVIGALASQPRYNDPYYDPRYVPPPPPPPPPAYQTPYGAYPYPDPYQQPGYGYGPYPGQGIVNCSSGNYRTTWCPIPHGARVSLYRKRSSASCTFGRDWGVGRGAIWVANGCRADFALQ